MAEDQGSVTPLDRRRTAFVFSNSKVADLAPLKGMPLNQLWLDFRAERDAEVLRSLKGLVQVNGKPAGDFWKAQEK
jgi:hypothetical protein